MTKAGKVANFMKCKKGSVRRKKSRKLVHEIKTKPAPAGQVIVPEAKKDFVFVPPGGLWNAFRKELAWNGERLQALAIRYNQIGKAEDKHAFVYRHIERVVQRNGGRFLRGHNGEGTSARRSFSVVTDKEWIRTELMRILTHIYNRAMRAEKKIHAEMGHMEKQLHVLENWIQGCRTVIRDIHDERLDVGTYTAIKRMRGTVDAVTKKALSCDPKIMGAQTEEDKQEEESSQSDNETESEEEDSDESSARSV